MRLRCRFGWHDWSNWSVLDSKKHDLVTTVTRGHIGYATYIMQETKCQSCGKVKQKTTIDISKL